MWVKEGDFSLPFDFGENGDAFAWMHTVLYYPMEAFEVKIVIGIWTQSIACSVFKMSPLRLLS